MFRFFFFSSRRRHTRCGRDWSSDVCSSDLLSNSPLMLGVVAFAGYTPILLVSLFAGVVVDHVDRRRLIVLSQRSEERRVGKEGRAGWAREQSKKKDRSIRTDHS